ncbi:FmdB family zinc ribbon protein [Pilimelia columellifera]|uniref:Putative regulatory protein FmdB zinc ribbon domain-containing protein n=1 Tax=Pilimelia columellifera subsp. columellifera TaxID=706583 RepID=A0ABN3NG42_9ACTN
MPTYQYACTACGHELEAVQSFSDGQLTECPQCAGRLRKVFSAVGVVFKGSGFYRTDSRGKAASAEPAPSGKNDAAKGATAADGGSSKSAPGASGGSAGSTSSASGTSSGSGSGSSGSGSSAKPAGAATA